MLNIDKDSIKVYNQSIFPAITFSVIDSQLEEDTIHIRIDGIVLSMDWRYISGITELPDIQVRDNPMVDGRMVTYASKARPIIDVSASAKTKNENDSGIQSFNTYKSELVFILNDKILEHIEHMRQQHKNKDIILYLIFKICYLKHSIKLRNYSMKLMENDNKMINTFENNPLEDKDTDTVSKILVKENNKNDANGLIFYLVDQFRRQIIIPSNEWTNNFQLQLENQYS
ncbi:MAG TPA: hypothetical protein VKA91_05175 [Nitrososphaeraceae archaeon]|nr:hypothetical protein [Nitrososphaeraceae archaeon]